MPDEKSKEALARFGKFVIRNLYDSALIHQRKLQAGEWRAPGLQELQSTVTALPEGTKQIIYRCVEDAVGCALHDFLFALQEAHDTDEGIELTVDGVNVAAVSDGLNGEPYGENGWLAKFSEIQP